MSNVALHRMWCRQIQQFRGRMLMAVALMLAVVSCFLQTSTSEPLYSQNKRKEDKALSSTDRNHDIILSSIEQHAGLGSVNGGDNSRQNRDSTASSSRFLERVERATDGVDDGRLGSDEIEQYIKLAVGGEHFDDDVEVENGALKALDSMDNHAPLSQSMENDLSRTMLSPVSDGFISKGELYQYWSSLQTLSTPEEVAEWVIHSVRLPQYADGFLKNAVTGFDLPLLLQEKGKMLVELGVSTSLHRRMFERAINMRLFGIAKEPRAVPSLTASISPGCQGVEISWAGAPNGGIKVHRYQVERSVAERGTAGTIPNRKSPGGLLFEERSIYSGDKRTATFVGLSPVQPYFFRVRAFNALGMGAWSEQIKVTLPTVCSTMDKSIVGPFGADVDNAVVSEEHTPSSLVGCDSNLESYAGDDEVQKSSMDFGSVAGSHVVAKIEKDKIYKHDGRRSKLDSEERSKDNSTQTSAASGFLQNVEKTTRGQNDMKLRRDEIEQFIQKLGGESFDEANEVGHGADRIFDSIDTDGGGNGVITLDELSRFWSSAPGFSTNRDVSDWVEFALLLPQYRSGFEEHSISPNDLSLLIADKGHLLRTMIGVVNEIHHAKIMRAIKMRLFGLGETPDTPSGLFCKESKLLKPEITLFWHMPRNRPKDVMPVHKFRFRRKVGKVHSLARNNNAGITTWEYLVGDEDTVEHRRSLYSYVDKISDVNAPVEYQVQAWNDYGGSDWSGSEICHGGLTILQAEDNHYKITKNASLWGLLERASAYLNTLSFIGQIFLVLVTVGLSIAPPTMRMALHTKIQRLPELLAKSMKKGLLLKKKFQGSFFWIWCFNNVMPCCGNSKYGEEADRERASLHEDDVSVSRQSSQEQSYYATIGRNGQRNGLLSRRGSRSLSISSSENNNDVSILDRITQETIAQEQALTPTRSMNARSKGTSKACSFVYSDGKVCGARSWWRGGRHNCMYCQQWFCQEHTGFANHSKFKSCNLATECVCSKCIVNHPASPRHGKNRARNSPKLMTRKSSLSHSSTPISDDEF